MHEVTAKPLPPHLGAGENAPVAHLDNEAFSGEGRSRLAPVLGMSVEECGSPSLEYSHPDRNRGLMAALRVGMMAG
jgi:hypothetical protein